MLAPSFLVWKFPMGFETLFGSVDRRHRQFVFESSLWDLKLENRMLDLRQFYGLKVPYGIWNKFVASSTCFLYKLFESSLWDLKQHIYRLFFPGTHGLKVPYGIWNQKGIDRAIRWACLKVPYGIWNWTWLTRLPIPDLFESSLWDLKHCFSKSLLAENVCVWKFPMGFETEADSLDEPSDSVWKFPMGFETTTTWTKSQRYSQFESSLWDLKPIKFRKTK